ncbi:MAG: DUF411 domain-containing protein [Leptospirales bacterium]
MKSNKYFLLFLLLLLFSLFAGCEKTPAASTPEVNVWDLKNYDASKVSKLEIEVYHSPTCGCCKKWISHLEKHNFKVIDIPTDNMDPVKQKLGVPAHLASCHTAVIDGYIIEGHVPAEDIVQLLTERPDIIGLTVPKMPVGTPGMENPGHKDVFSVFSFEAPIDPNAPAGKVSIFKHYEKY